MKTVGPWATSARTGHDRVPAIAGSSSAGGGKTRTIVLDRLWWIDITGAGFPPLRAVKPVRGRGNPWRLQAVAYLLQHAASFGAVGAVRPAHACRSSAARPSISRTGAMPIDAPRRDLPFQNRRNSRRAAARDRYRKGAEADWTVRQLRTARATDGISGRHQWLGREAGPHLTRCPDRCNAR
jgi:hypothetical protein